MLVARFQDVVFNCISVGHRGLYMAGCGYATAVEHVNFIAGQEIYLGWVFFR